MRSLIALVLLSCLPSVALAGGARPDWAFATKTPDNAPPKVDDGKAKQVPGSSKTYTQKQIDDPMNPPDWFPDEHAPLPQVAAHGGGPGVRACIGCHLPTGLGHPENSRIPGSTAAYMQHQLADFRSGARKGEAAGTMITIAKGMTEDEITSAVAYFSGLKATPWTKVVETDTVVKTFFRGTARIPWPEAGKEPIGNRIVEIPDNDERAELRDPHSGFVSYVPVGAIAKGQALVTTGGGGTTIPDRKSTRCGSEGHRRRPRHRRPLARQYRAPALLHPDRRPRRRLGGPDEGRRRQPHRRRHPQHLRLRGLARAVAHTLRSFPRKRESSLLRKKTGSPP